jgi:Conserved TM helix/Mechanosensitive ion channel
MTVIASTILDRSAVEIGAFLPRLGAALAILIVGYVVAWIIGRVVTKALAAIGFDDLADTIGLNRELRRFGLTSPASNIVGRAVRFAVVVVVVVSAIAALGLAALTASLNAAILFLPKLFAAAILVLVGLVLARFVRDRVDRAATRMDLAGPLGALAEAVIIAAFVVSALAQLSVPLAILTLVVTILIAAVSFSAALAFGLGSRDAARQVAAGRTLTGSLHVGQTITVGDVTGEIQAMEGAALILRTSSKSTFRVPNHVLLESVVEVHDDAPAAASTVAP